MAKESTSYGPNLAISLMLELFVASCTAISE